MCTGEGEGEGVREEGKVRKGGESVREERRVWEKRRGCEGGREGRV